jgi:predicted GIY-YIG superfamily endonuclease
MANMGAEEVSQVQPLAVKWFVYLLRCADGSLYAGITKDLDRRCRQHNNGTASRYTRCRRPVQLVYQENHASRRLALRREAALKALTRQEKESLIRLGHRARAAQPVRSKTS